MSNREQSEVARAMRAETGRYVGRALGLIRRPGEVFERLVLGMWTELPENPVAVLPRLTDWEGPDEENRAA